MSAWPGPRRSGCLLRAGGGRRVTSAPRAPRVPCTCVRCRWGWWMIGRKRNSHPSASRSPPPPAPSCVASARSNAASKQHPAPASVAPRQQRQPPRSWRPRGRRRSRGCRCRGPLGAGVNTAPCRVRLIPPPRTCPRQALLHVLALVLLPEPVVRGKHLAPQRLPTLLLLGQRARRPGGRGGAAARLTGALPLCLAVANGGVEQRQHVRVGLRAGREARGAGGRAVR